MIAALHEMNDAVSEDRLLYSNDNENGIHPTMILKQICRMHVSHSNKMVGFGGMILIGWRGTWMHAMPIEGG